MWMVRSSHHELSIPAAEGSVPTPRKRGGEAAVASAFGAPPRRGDGGGGRASLMRAVTARHVGRMASGGWLAAPRSSVRGGGAAAASALATTAGGVPRSDGDAFFRAAAWRALHLGFRASSVSTKPTGHVADLAFGPSLLSPRLAVGSTLPPYEALAYDLCAGQCVVLGRNAPHMAPLAPHACTVPCVRFTASGTRSVTGSYDRTVRVWDAAEGSLLRVLGHPVAPEPPPADDVPDNAAEEGEGEGEGEGEDGGGEGGAAAAAGAGAAGAAAAPPVAFGGGPPAVMEAEEGVGEAAAAFAAAADAAENVPLELAPWAYGAGAETAHEAEVTCIATHPRRDGLCASGGKDARAVLWDLDRGLALRQLKARADPLDLSFGRGATERQLFGAIDTPGPNGSGQLCSWEVETGAPMFSLVQPRGHVSCLHAAASGGTLLYGSADGAVRQVHASDGRELWTYKTGMSDVNLLSLSCDGTYVQASGDTNMLVILDVRKPHTPVHELRHEVVDYVNGVSAAWCHRSHSTIVTGADDETVRIWDVALGTPEVARLRGHTAPVSIVAISPEDDLIASGGDEGKVVLYSRRTDARSAYLLSHEQDNVLMRNRRQDEEAQQQWLAVGQGRRRL